MSRAMFPGARQSLVIGAFFGFSLSIGCGALSNTPPKECNSSNCTGCCDASGTCQQTTSQNQCGFAGQTCKVCGLNDECFGGSCTPIYRVARPDPVDSGTAAVSDAGSSTACSMSCAGCCAGDVCRSGSSTLECGGGGATCRKCTFPQSCTNNTCVGDVPDAGGGTVDAGPVAFCGACTYSADCGGTKNFCLGTASSAFCGADCSADQACPTNTVCANIRDNLGTTIIGQNCVPASGRSCATLTTVLDAGTGSGGGTGGGGGSEGAMGDTCALAIPIVLGSTYQVTPALASSATGQYTPTKCGSSQGAGPDMVFKFEVTATTPQPLRVQISGCSPGGIVATLDNTCSSSPTSTTELVCQSDFGEGTLLLGIDGTLAPGTYFVKVDTNNAALCGFAIN